MAVRLTTNSASAQVYASQGESTPAAPLPRQFQARNQVSDAAPGVVPLDRPADHLALVPGQPSAVVLRAPRMVGMRYLYAFGHRTMSDISRDAAGATANPFISAFQKFFHGPIKNGGFNDALYQAGYPGFNLGLSFAVQTIQSPSTGPRNVDAGSRPPEMNVGPTPGARTATYPPRYYRASYKVLGR